MSKRDDFSEPVKRAVAARAGWHCSFDGCPKLTIGPSEESPEGTTKIADVAHICAAAPGPGARRYDPSMTSAERSSIENAIWLCTDHARLIDRDEVTYTADVLRGMKRRHEAAIARVVRTGSGMDFGTGLLAIGPDIVCSGDLQEISEGGWIVHLKRFVLGDPYRLASFIDGFSKAPPEDRYVLSNELGDGRVLERSPTLQRRTEGYSLLCPVLPSFPRTDAHRLGGDLAVHPETGDLYLNEEGDIAHSAGAERLLQMVQSVLSLQRGESPFSPRSGMRFFEFFETFGGSLWLEKLLMLDVVRQAAIPCVDSTMRQSYLPLQCVTRVYGVELLADVPIDHRLPVRLDLDVKGVGRWRQQMLVYMPTKDQMEQVERVQALNANIWQQTPFQQSVDADGTPDGWTTDPDEADRGRFG